MKNAKEIVSHLQNAPAYKDLKRYKALEAFKNLLPFSLRKAILFVYEKSGILFFVLNHPAYKQEFDYKATLIKDLLKAFRIQETELSAITDVRWFVSNKISPPEPEPSSTEPRYTEHARGDFENRATNETIIEAIEAIRTLLCTRNS